MMTGKGLAKLIEECGELIQVAGKRLAYYTTDYPPDNGPRLTQRLEEEICDVMAAYLLVVTLNELELKLVDERETMKFKRFMEWHEDTENNIHGIDATGSHK